MAVRRIASVAAAVAVATAAIPAAGQSQATLRGRVLDSETGQAVVGAAVTVRGVGGRAIADTLGAFIIENVPRGEAQISIQAPGYANADFRMSIPESGGVERMFPLDFTGQRLDRMTIEARAEALIPRYQDFERRRARGLGAFLRWDEMAAKSYGSVGDALRSVRGVRIQCNQQRFECHAVMARTPQCQPLWFIDGVEVRSFHENTPIRDVYGIEVYRGPGEVPGEYAGSNAACGAIVMWTKSRPYRIEP